MDQIAAMRVFARVVEAGTFTRAADLLQMPTPSVTKMIQQLESHLRVKLLQRTTRRVTVTPEGAAYYERISRVLADIDDIESDVTNAQTRPKGRLRVDIGSALANRILVPRLPEFHARYPDILLELGVSDRAVHLIGDGVDCVLRGGVLSDPSLVARRVAQMPYMTCATPDYLKRHGVPATPADLTHGHRVVSYFSARTGRYVPPRYERGDERIEINGHVVMAANESTAHLTALLTGLGVAQTFAFMARPYVESGALVELLADWEPPPMPVSVAYPSSRHPSAKLRAFVDWSVEVFGPYDSTRLR